MQLRLRQSLVGDIDSFVETVGTFVESAIVKLPCRFQFNAKGKNVWASGTGWTRDVAKLNKLAFGWMRHWASELESTLSNPLANKEAVAKQALLAGTMSAIHDATIKSVVWHTSDEIKIEDLGVCRIHVPSFIVNGQHAPYFMYARPGSDGKALKVFDFEHGTTIGMAANDISVISWKGMSIHARSLRDMHYTVWDIIPNWEDVFVEIDVTNNQAGKLSLNREFLDIQGDDDIHHAIHQKCHKHIAGFRSTVAEQLANSPYASLWYARRHSSRIPKQVPRYWSQMPSTSEALQSGYVEWSPVELPAVDRLDWLPHNSLTFRNNSVSEQHLLSRYASSWAQMTLPWTPTGMSLLCKNGDRIAIVPVWLNADDCVDYCEAAGEYGSYERVAKFPPTWSDVAGVSPPVGPPIWNEAFPPVVAYRREAKKWLRDQCKNGFWFEAEEPLQIVSAAMGDPSRESAILLDCLRSSQRWVALTQVAPEVVGQLWDRWVGRSRCLHYVTHRVKDKRLETKHKVFTRDGCRMSPDLAALPDPGSDWQIEAR